LTAAFVGAWLIRLRQTILAIHYPQIAPAATGNNVVSAIKDQKPRVQKRLPHRSAATVAVGQLVIPQLHPAKALRTPQ
jgi:hypothetical protein